MKKGIVCLVLCLAVWLCIDGCGKKVERMQLPAADKVSRVQITFNQRKVLVKDREWIKGFWQGLNASKLTNRQSVNDQPTNVEEYYSVDFYTETGGNRVYVYQKLGRTYGEIPYQGIYLCNEDVWQHLATLLK